MVLLLKSIRSPPRLCHLIISRTKQTSRFQVQEWLGVSERNQIDSLGGGAASGAKMKRDMTVSRAIRMTRAAEAAMAYFQSHPEKRCSKYDLCIVQRLVNASGHPSPANAFLSQHAGHSNAARSRRRVLHQQATDGLARILGGSDPEKERDEIIKDMQSNKTAPLLPIGKFGYVLTTDAGDDSGSVGEDDDVDDDDEDRNEGK
jgi:hypothetical protein